MFPSPAWSGAADRTQQGQQELIPDYGESSSTRGQPGAQGPLATSCLEVIPQQDWLSHLSFHRFACPRFIPPPPCLRSSSFCSRDREQALKLLFSCPWQGDKYPKIPDDPHFTPTASPLDYLPWLSTSLENDTFPISLSGLAPIRHSPTLQGYTENRDGFFVTWVLQSPKSLWLLLTVHRILL